MKFSHMCFILLTLTSIYCTSCAADYNPIITGTYFTQESYEEKILVFEKEIFFHIKVNDHFIDNKYSYTVLSDGRIQPFPMTSSDAILGVGRFDWYWDGKSIIQQNPKTGKKVKYHLH